MLNKESFGFGPYVGACADTGAYQIVGACSDQLSPSQIKKARQGQRFIKRKKAKLSKIPAESFASYCKKRDLLEQRKYC